MAVIVVLAIIAIIATPIVLNLIENARKGATVDSAYGVRNEAKLVFSTTMIDYPNSFYKIEVDFSKEMTKNGKQYIETKLFNSPSSEGITGEVLFELDGKKPTLLSMQQVRLIMRF